MNLSGRGDAFEFKEDTQLIEKRGERSTPAGVPDFCPDVEGRSPEDSGLPRDPPTPHDPVRVSHLPVRQSVRHPSGVVYLICVISSRGLRHFVPRHPV